MHIWLMLLCLFMSVCSFAADSLSKEEEELLKQMEKSYAELLRSLEENKDEYIRSGGSRIYIHEAGITRARQTRELYIAVANEDLEAARRALENGADPNTILFEIPVLHIAAALINEEMILLLLDYGVDVNCTDNLYKMTALHILYLFASSETEQVAGEILKILMNHGANDSTDSDNKEPRDYLPEKHKKEENIKKGLQQLQMQDRSRYSPGKEESESRQEADSSAYEAGDEDSNHSEGEETEKEESDAETLNSTSKEGEEGGGSSDDEAGDENSDHSEGEESEENLEKDEDEDDESDIETFNSTSEEEGDIGVVSKNGTYFTLRVDRLDRIEDCGFRFSSLFLLGVGLLFVSDKTGIGISSQGDYTRF